MKQHVTPKTKILELLDNFPELEDYLISLVPAFVKLKNPVLRNTIARMATVEHAASVGNVSLSFLINSINEKLGLSPSVYEDYSVENENINIEGKKLISTLNADEIIATGEKPVSTVMKKLNMLSDEEMLRLDCSFHPAPLIEMAREKGYAAKEIKNHDNSFSVFFVKK